MGDEQATHRPGAYKQPNKRHKTGRHRSKGQLYKEAKGRVNAQVVSRHVKGALGRVDRRNKTVQVRKQKREENLNKKRQRGGQSSPPFLVAIIQLSADASASAALELIKSCDETAVVQTNAQGISHISIPRFKKRYSFLCPQYGDLYSTLDAVKMADSLILLTSAGTGVDNWGDYCLQCLFAQGVPAAVLTVQGLKSLSAKKQNETKKSIQKQFENRFPDEKLHSLDSTQDALLVVRTVGNQRLKPILLRERRAHMIAEDISFVPDSEESQHGTLKVTGYIRGQPLSVNGLVHLPGWGDFQMTQIDAPEDPYPLSTRVDKGRRKAGDVEMEDKAPHVRVLEKVNPAQQQSLHAEADVDPMEGEQTWPTEEELAEAEAEQKTQKTKKLVPKGTSEYQAAWIVDSDDEGGHDDDDDDNSEDDSDADDDMMGEDELSDEEEGSDQDEDEEEELEEVTVTDDAAKYDATINMDEEVQMLEKYKAARLDEMFPDEMDTPKELPARTRFQRYRGLQSFRTSPWDTKENLPSEYSRIFQFGDFKRTKKRVLSEDREDGALPGWYVTVHISNVPRDFMDTKSPGSPTILYSLLPHEQKMSVVHFMVKRAPGSTIPIRSKERLIFHVGYRRFAACPVYSQHTNGSKHKFERYFRTDAVMVATVYAPIMFSPASVLMFKEHLNGQHKLVATGSLLSVNPDRITTKRVILSGHPFKINKKSATVRYMFYNREDILWFKPVEIRTKYGRRGHIKDPLGTHGHMKVTFDGQLKSMDTVLLTLYKRVYPKWTYDCRVAPSSSSIVEVDDSESMDATSELFD